MWVLAASWRKRLDHGCARVAHCSTARWRNFSHYCCPLRLSYVFWAQRSTGLCADSTRCTQTRVYSARGKYIVRHWSRREASLRHSSGWGNWSVSPQYRDLRSRGLDARFPPLGSRVRVSVPPCGFRRGRNGVCVSFSRGFSRFPLPQISFHHFSILISSIFVSFHPPLWWCVRRGSPAPLLLTDL